MQFYGKSRKTAVWVMAVVIGAVVPGGVSGSGAYDKTTFERHEQGSSTVKGAMSMSTCKGVQDPFLYIMEREVAAGEWFRVLAVSESPLGEVYLMSGRSRAEEMHAREISGPPYARHFRARAPDRPGGHVVELVSKAGVRLTCVEVAVRDNWVATPRSAPDTGIWQITRSWNEAWERVFSAWISHLFRPLPGQPTGWRPLHSVLHDRERNFLHNVLGHREDDRSSPVHVRARADCGDAPYQLRAYFAWKLGLPFRFSRCTRGNGAKGPTCPVARDNLITDFDPVAHPVERFNAFIREAIAWQVHSGTMRTLPEDDTSDFYPIALGRGSIRPGTVFVDVGGHALIVTQWDSSGLYAIDGHPDMSVTRRRFSPRYFRYYRGLRTGGFKAFRPLSVQGREIIPVPNSALARYFSVEQYGFASRGAFYARMNRLIEGRF